MTSVFFGRSYGKWFRDHPWAAFRRGVAAKSFFLFVLLLGGQWMLIAHFAGESPFGDQWNAEARQIYLPMLRGSWTWSDLFLTANEHRIVPTRLLDVMLFRATGMQWDPKVQLAASAVVHSLWLSLLAVWLMRRTRLKLHGWIVGAILVVGLLPLAYDNLLWAFQSQFYFLLLFSSLAGWGLLGASPRQFRWWMGVGAALLAFLSMGSGGLMGAAILAVIGLRVVKRFRWTLSSAGAAAVGFGMLVATWKWRVEVTEHNDLATQSWTAFSLAGWRLLAWPYSSLILMAPIVWLPAMILTGHRLRSTKSAGTLEEGAFFLGVLSLAQLAALAWLRGEPLTFSPPSSRYLDLMLLGLLANLAALLALVSVCRKARWTWALLGGWSAVAICGLAPISLATTANSLGMWRDNMRAEVARLAFFDRTHNPTVLQANEAWDPAAAHFLAEKNELGSALPPALQGKPPVGFTFEPDDEWAEGNLDPALGPPGGYAAWGNWSHATRRGGAFTVLSTPFVLSRGAVTLSFAISTGGSSATLELVADDGGAKGIFRSVPRPNNVPIWEEMTVILPPGTYRLRVRDEREAGWVAVSAPREMSRLGFSIRWWLAEGSTLALGGAVGLGMLLAWPRPRPQRNSRK